ncbi:methyltransferase domain-containing protein [Aquabacterium humicola]|uniref:methyltransferase domain-containing protein n=1 Tax=Aquabacterium humicola TaxID=3237377 RepID=UPI0025433899|nr:methyltransferase domain-containing protein [Rubrivivax pictus]
MDSASQAFYAHNARDIAERYEAGASSIARHFSHAFAPGSRVLDVGAGSGRDLAQLHRSGFDAFGVEPVTELREGAIRHHPELLGRLEAGALPLDRPFDGSLFDGVVCSAVLMHVPEAELFDAALSLKRTLQVHGRLLMSLPAVRDDVGDKHRDGHGRLFMPYRAEFLQLLFERLGFQMIGRWDDEDALGRGGVRWFTLLFELRAGGPARAVDQIEGILNRDRKVATYKLALFRAFAELAMQEPRCATWRPDGSVGIPVRRLAEKWLGYYWPIFAAPVFIPQMQSETSTGTGVAFRRPMLALMEPYRNAGPHGGLSIWTLGLQAGRLSGPVQRLHLRALSAIATAICNGPVVHSGGSLDGGAVFSHDRSRREVVMSAELWRELSLLGHWIADAVVVRWASLSERFGYRDGVQAGTVLPLLLAKAEAERATLVARQIYRNHAVDRCTWTDRRLDEGFAVDHVIPFALWGCNDLWNLMPVTAAANNQKSDKLPDADLLRARRDQIVGYWTLLRDGAPEAFDREAERLIGRRLAGPVNWVDDLFSTVREAIEVTALQRGVARWSPLRSMAAGRLPA